MKIPFVGPSYAARSLPISAQTCVNWYLEVNDAGAKAPVSLLNTPGMVQFADLGTDKPVVNIHVMGNYLYAISGGKLFQINTTGNVVDKGEVMTTAERIHLSENGLQLMGADDQAGMIFTEADGLQSITDADFDGAASLCYFDGYFVFIHPDTGRFAISALKDGLSYDALKFANAEGSPDKLVACINDHRQLWLFGEKTIEIWYNSGASYFPFSRYGGAFIELGCAAKFSPAKADNTVFWLGNDLAIHRAVKFSPVRISTHAIEAAILSYPSVNDAFGYTYNQEGHTFYVLTFPSAPATWVFDAAVGAWHERKSYDINRHRANCYAFFNGKHIIGDYDNGKLYYYDLQTYTDDGDPIVRERTTQVLSADGENLFMASLQVLFEHGVGLFSGQGEEPQAMLQWSDDGGRTWSNEIWTGMGKMGKYGYRSIWRRLGSFRERVFRVRVSDPVKAIMIDASAEFSQMNQQGQG